MSTSHDINEIIRDLHSSRHKYLERGLAGLTQVLQSPGELASLDKLALLPYLKILEPRQSRAHWISLFADSDGKVSEVALEHCAESLPPGERLPLLRDMAQKQPPLFREILLLLKKWSEYKLGDALWPLLDSCEAAFLVEAIPVLCAIDLSYFQSRLEGLLHHADREVRKALAESFLTWGGKKIHTAFYEACLADSEREIQALGLKGIRLAVKKSSIPALTGFARSGADLPLRNEALRLLGRIEHPTSVEALLEIYIDPDLEGLKWSVQQALSNIDQKYSIGPIAKKLQEDDGQHLPLMLELAGHLEGEEADLMLRDLLNRHREPGMRALIVGAMGMVAHPACEPVLLALMNEELPVAYAASAALKNVVRDKVLVHYEHFLQKADLDDLIRQIIIQHVGEAARTLPVPPSLVSLLEGMLSSANDNVRYLSIVSLGNIASESSLPSLIKALSRADLQVFRSDVERSLLQCSGRRLAPFLDQMIHQAAEAEFCASIREFVSSVALKVEEEALELLGSQPVFSAWEWEESLAESVRFTGGRDKSFIWKSLARKELGERACLLLLRALDLGDPRSEELLEPAILINCFTRFQNRSIAILLSKLMAIYGHPDFLPLLIRYSEGADEDTAILFRSHVRAIVMQA
ncbi:MAG: hypothetical protein HQL31_00200 [Planctomycetes bacterium]|nr:hypothetical protein [Planctomycetota bacterium]